MSKPPRASEGGSRTAQGTEFQARTFAYWAALLAAGAPVGLGFSRETRAESIGAEVGLAMDDIGIILDAGGYVLIQAKSGIQRVDARSSDFQKAIAQAVAVQIDGLPAPDSRPLDPLRDRLVIAVDERASRSFDALERVLDRFQSWPLSLSVESAAKTVAESKVLKTTRDVLLDAWASTTSEPIPPDVERCILASLRVRRYDFSDQGAARLGVSSLAGDSSNALAVLVEVGLAAARTQSWRSAHDIQSALGTTFAVSDATLRRDRATLGRLTRLELVRLGKSSELRTSRGPVRIDRTAVQTLREVTDGYLLVGTPGCGKSGILAEIASSYDGEKVVLSVDSIPTDPTLAQLQWGLSRSLVEVLTADPEGPPATLFLDGLDAHRDGGSWLVDLVASLRGSRWRVIASIREFQLVHSARWRSLFVGQRLSVGVPSTALKNVRYFEVSDLSEDELLQACGAIPALGEVLRGARPGFQQLLRNPFNLSLAVELLRSGDTDGVGGVASQAELLGLFWANRIDDGARSVARRTLIHRLTRRMVASRSLEASLDGFQPGELDVVEDLISRGVIVQSELAGRLLTLTGTVRFRHHVVFDYAVAAWVAEHEEGIRTVLHDDPNFMVYARPAIDFVLADLWLTDQSRRPFWYLAADPSTAEHPMLAAAIAATAVESIADTDDCAALVHTRFTLQQVDLVLDQLASALSNPISRRPGMSARGIAELDILIALHGERVLSENEKTTPHAGLGRLIWTLDDAYPLPRTTPQASAHAGMVGQLLKFALVYPTERAWLAGAMSHVIVHAAQEKPAVAAALTAMLEPPAIESLGLLPLRPVLSQIVELAHADEEVAERVAAAVLSFSSSDPERQTRLGSSLIMPMRESWSQAHEGLVYQLVEDSWGRFVQDFPVQAIRAFCRSMDGSALERGRTFELKFGELRGYVFGYGHLIDYERETNRSKVTSSSLARLVELRGPLLDTSFAELVVALHGPDTWRSLMEAADSNERLAELICQLVIESGDIDLNYTFRRGFRKLLSSVKAQIPDLIHQELELRVLELSAAARSAGDEFERDQIERAAEDLLRALSFDRLAVPELRQRHAALPDADRSDNAILEFEEVDEGEIVASYRWELDGLDRHGVPQFVLDILDNTSELAGVEDGELLWARLDALTVAEAMVPQAVPRLAATVRARAAETIERIVDAAAPAPSSVRGTRLVSVLRALLDDTPLPEAVRE